MTAEPLLIDREESPTTPPLLVAMPQSHVGTRCLDPDLQRDELEAANEFTPVR